MTVQNSARSYLGIAKETTEGTAVTATAFIPVAQGKLKPVDIIDPLYDTGLRGSLVKNYAYVQGRTRSTVDFGGPVFADTFPWALSGLLGSIATTGSSAPYTHTISLKNAASVGADTQPTSLTFTDFYGAAVRQYAGCSISDVNLTFTAEGLLDYDAKATGWASVTTTAPTPSFGSTVPVATWLGTVSVAGTQVSNAVSGNIQMTRPVTPIYGISATQNPYNIFLGALETTGKIKFVMEDDTQLTNFITNSQPAIVLNWSSGSGSSAIQIQATLTKGAYTAAMIDRSGDYVTVEVDLNAQGNTTDAGASAGYSNIKWVVKNSVASGSYI